LPSFDSGSPVAREAAEEAAMMHHLHEKLQIVQVLH
jgi:hypothetical protein